MVSSEKERSLNQLVRGGVVEKVRGGVSKAPGPLGLARVGLSSKEESRKGCLT